MKDIPLEGVPEEVKALVSELTHRFQRLAKRAFAEKGIEAYRPVVRVYLRRTSSSKEAFLKPWNDSDLAREVLLPAIANSAGRYNATSKNCYLAISEYLSVVDADMTIKEFADTVLVSELMKITKSASGQQLRFGKFEHALLDDVLVGLGYGRVRRK